MLAIGIGPRRAWTNNYSLWQYALQVEPKAMRHQFNFAGESMKLNRFDDATYHRLIAMYLVNRFPKKVEWERVQSVESLPKKERIARLPSALFDDEPCPIVIGFLTQVRPISTPWHDHALGIFLNAYPQCFQRPGS